MPPAVFTADETVTMMLPWEPVTMKWCWLVAELHSINTNNISLYHQQHSFIGFPPNDILGQKVPNN